MSGRACGVVVVASGVSLADRLSWGWQVVVEACEGPVGRVMSRFPDRLHGGSDGAHAAAVSDAGDLLEWELAGGCTYAVERVCW